MPTDPMVLLVLGGLAWVGVITAIGAAALVAEIPSAIAWSTGAFAATTVFLVAASLQLVLAPGLGPGEVHGAERRP